MSFRLLMHQAGESAVHFATGQDFTTQTEAVAEAKGMLEAQPTWTILVTEDVAVISLAPTVVELRPGTPPVSQLPAPTIPHRTEPGRDGDQVLNQVQLEKAIQDAAAAGPPRVPAARPRLLITATRPSNEEYMRHMMVVAEGKIVKNSFGPLELDDMPLTPIEREQVMHALARVHS